MTTRQTPDAVREAVARETLAKQYDASMPSRAAHIRAGTSDHKAIDAILAFAALDSRAGDADEFATVEEWEHDDQRELSRLYIHKAHDGPQFNRGQMRAAIRHGKRLAAPAVDAVPAGEVDTYSRWLAGDETLPTLPREQYLRFQASSDRAIKNRRRTPQTVADGVEEVRRNPDDPDWDNCPACKGGALDTGYECNTCGFDAQPLVHLKDACEARGERMHPSGLYESEIAHPFLAALSHGEGRK